MTGEDRSAVVDRWTAETQQVAANALASSVVGSTAVAHDVSIRHARAVLTALADAGVLITPREQAVLDAVGAWHGLRNAYAHLAALARILDAVDGLDAP